MKYSTLNYHVKQIVRTADGSRQNTGRSITIGPTLTKLIDVVVPSMSRSRIFTFFAMSPIPFDLLAISEAETLLVKY